jgi:hypothetical protein
MICLEGYRHFTAFARNRIDAAEFPAHFAFPFGPFSRLTGWRVWADDLSNETQFIHLDGCACLPQFFGERP